MRHYLLPVTLLALSSLVVGCDASAVPGVGSNSDASAGFRALIGALNGNGPSALHIDDERSDTFRGAELDGVGGDVDVTGACSGGGSVSFAGTLDISGTAGADAADFDPLDPDEDDIDVHVPEVNFEYTVSFDGCQEDGVRIDGEMTWSLASSWDADDLVLSMEWAFVGGVDFSGAATGHCDFDFSGSASSEDQEGWTEVDLDAAQGTVCGYEANEVLDEDAEDGE